MVDQHSDIELQARIVAQLLAILPQDGTAIPNRAARALISRNLSRAITNDDYFAARDHLIKDRVIGRVRGQGGSVFLLDEAEEQLPPVVRPLEQTTTRTALTGILEKDLMLATQRALVNQFLSELDLPHGSPEPIVQDISTTGPKTGVWTRPDFVLVSVSSFAVLPGAQVDTHVFELKNESGGGIRAVHEALSQSRYANFAHLVWFVPNGSPRELEMESVAEYCALHGVGLIRLRLNSMQDGELEIVVEASRKQTSTLEIDGFLEARLTEASKDALARAIRGSTNQ